MSWRDTLTPDRVLTDAEIADMTEQESFGGDATFVIRALTTTPLRGVTLSRVLLHHQTLVAEIERLTLELHAGHTLVPQSLYTAPNVRPGWMICVRCKYETPSCGYCTVHNTLDKCWALTPVPAPSVSPKPCEGTNHRWLCPCGVLPNVGDPCQCGQSMWTWPAPPLLPLKES